MNNIRIIKICDECESEYFSDTSKMDSLCPNCSYHLYGYKNCQHIFIDGRCVNCYIDEKIFMKMENTRWKMEIRKPLNIDNFWSNNEYYAENYVEKPLTDEMIAFTENKLGYKLPQSYIELMRIQNGGNPKKEYWYNGNAKEDEVNTIGIAGFFGIGSNKSNSIFGKFGNEFWFDEWEYPRDLGIIIADTESGGHDMIYLDYRECGKEGEPKVSVCFAEYDNRIRVLANSFDEFIAMLVTDQELDNFWG